jgi:hypothetical protein
VPLRAATPSKRRSCVSLKLLPLIAVTSRGAVSGPARIVPTWPSENRVAAARRKFSPRRPRTIDRRRAQQSLHRADPAFAGRSPSCASAPKRRGPARCRRRRVGCDRPPGRAGVDLPSPPASAHRRRARGRPRPSPTRGLLEGGLGDHGQHRSLLGAMGMRLNPDSTAADNASFVVTSPVVGRLTEAVMMRRVAVAPLGTKSTRLLLDPAPVRRCQLSFPRRLDQHRQLAQRGLGEVLRPGDATGA